VWIGGSNRGDGIQKYTADGKLLWDFGHRGPYPQPGQPPPPARQNNQDTDVLPNGMFFFDLDEDAHELYIVDAKRVLVYDMDNGAFKRGWGGHGIPLSEIDNDPTPPYDWKSGPPPDQKQFAPALHCVHFSVDGLVYIRERGSNRMGFHQAANCEQLFRIPDALAVRMRRPRQLMFGMCGTTTSLLATPMKVRADR
jgi:hypothetical protein